MHIPLTATQLSDPIHLEDDRSMPLLQVPQRKQDHQAPTHLILCQNPTEKVFGFHNSLKSQGHVVKRILLLKKDSHVKTEKTSIHQVRQSPHRDMRNLERTRQQDAPEFYCSQASDFKDNEEDEMPHKEFRRRLRNNSRDNESQENIGKH